MRQATRSVPLLLAAMLGAAGARAAIIEDAAQASMQIGPDGLAVVAFHDPAEGLLKLARCVDADCSAVTLRVLDTVGGVGNGFSPGADVAMGPNGPVVSYVDTANGDLKIALCGDPACEAVTIAVLDDEADTGSLNGTSVVLGTDGRPLVAYARGSAFFQARTAYVAHCDAADCSARTLTSVGSTPGYSAEVVIGGDGLGAVLFTSNLGTFGIAFRHCANAACTAFSPEPPRPALIPPLVFDFRPAAVVGADGFVRYTATYYSTTVPTRIRVTRCLDALCSSSTFEDLLDGFDTSSPAFGTDGSLRIAFDTYQYHGQQAKLAQCLDAGCAAVQSTCAAALGREPSLSVDASGPLVAYTRGSRVEIVRPGTAATCPLTVLVENIRNTEGSTLPFALHIAPFPTSDLVISYETTPGTATAGVDYLPVAGQLTFGPGHAQSPNLQVTTLRDTVNEPDETVGFVVTAPGAVVADGTAVGVIEDDDPPELSVSDCTTVEGDAGTAGCVFDVTLSEPHDTGVVVSFATSAGTATAGVDFLSQSGALTFAPGTVSHTVSVSVVGDTSVETDETFFLDLLAASGATIDDGTGAGLIQDDDAPSLSAIELTHGTRLTADLAADPGPTPDVDHYRIAQSPYGSYEVVTDAVSGDLAGGLVLERLAEDNATVLQTAQATGTGGSVALRWSELAGLPETRETLRVRSTACTTDCGADDTYRLRFYETTASIARFNNSDTQVTVVLLQNPGDREIAARLYFWSAAGALAATTSVTVAPHGMGIVNTAVIPGAAGESGSVTVAHDGGYGGLAGKAVALEPATGFVFDTPLAYRPR